mgnify:CR=1 FL=1
MKHSNGQAQQFTRLKSLLVFTVIFMSLGTLIELFLLSHYEDEWQLLPIILISAALLIFIFLLINPKAWLIIGLKILLWGCALSGALGAYFHIRANLEFEAELHPTQSFTQHLIDSLSGALPALAPGSMLVFALIGYIHLYIQHKTIIYEKPN